MQKRIERTTRRKNKEPTTSSITENAEAASESYQKEAAEMMQRLDAAIAADMAGTPAAGASLSLGQNPAQQIVKPGMQATEAISSEALVQNFRQTSGE